MKSSDKALKIVWWTALFIASMSTAAAAAIAYVLYNMFN